MSSIENMIRYGFIIACCLGVACGRESHKGANNARKGVGNPTIHNEPVSPDNLISPGKGIGLIHLDENADNLIQALGKPDRSDAAMGASMMLWFDNHDVSGYFVSVYAHHNMGAKDEHVSRIKQIRVTSPVYQTSSGIGVGASLQSIQKYFMPLKKHVSGIYIYDDVKAGIAFEINKANKCSAIIVHAATDTRAAYINMRND